MNNKSSDGANTHTPDSSQGLTKRYRIWLQFEVVLLCILMAVVWGLLSLPIIFYYHPIPVVSVSFMWRKLVIIKALMVSCDVNVINDFSSDCEIIIFNSKLMVSNSTTGHGLK